MNQRWTDAAWGRTRAVAAAGVLAVLVVFPGGARAQTVVGEVREQGTGQPLRGAFVQLEDTTGARVGGVLADSLGRFVLRAPRAGRYRVVAELIGYAGTASELLAVNRQVAARVTLEVPVEAVSLEGITAGVEQRCRPRPGSGPATARLWEEARKALELALWTREEQMLQFRAVEHLRTVDARTLEIIDESRTGRAGYHAQSPYLSIPADELEASGYIQRQDGGMWQYYAPDAQVLLSESFLSTHCFRVVRSRDEPGSVGLGFEPVPERRQPDIRGTLWLDEGTAELRHLEYVYTSLPFNHGNWPQVGGDVEFERLATGQWIVRRWDIRMPRDAVRQGGTMVLRTFHEQGAEIETVRTGAGEVLSEATGATVYGTVTGPAGEPLEGVEVTVAGARRQAVTGGAGTYRLTDLEAGVWTVEVRHPVLDAMGLGTVTNVVEARPGQASRLPFHLGQMLGARDVCRHAGWDGQGDPVLVYGQVRGPDGPRAGAAVWLEGADPTVADSAGVYQVCRSPSRRPVMMELDGALLLPATLREAGFVRLDLPPEDAGG